ncbi:hypothetical protein PVL29_013025 [Vitis rotundifolia]|uniref:Adenylate-forming reductase n=1 Tax=Vitis rotundifolia TaxID=103349 RepID=A0AA38ZKA1_VITRO|nr:hypothetical protein PVL29_013025 [Vitis rotundifolia]
MDVFPLSNALERSLSRRSSSHFCDLDFADEADKLECLEEKANIWRNKSLFRKKPKESRLSIILLDQGLFTVYKRLLLVCLALNIAAFVFAATGYFPYAKCNATLFSIGNILALSLCRSEAFLLVVFWPVVKLLGKPWVPLPLKTAITSFLQSLGGVHSGCGISSIAWLVYALVLTIKDRDNTSVEILVVASTILSLLCITSLAAFPLVRHLHHNVFERTHRFAAWTALVLLWAFIVLKNCYNPTLQAYDFRVSKLQKSQDFWFTLAITMIIILPWVTVRKVAVKVTASSNHASIIKFEGGWHAFGIISDGENGHMMLAGAVGDFTKSLVSKPPSHLWVRKLHFAGLPYLTNLYQRVLLVATGSGICVFLSFLLQPSSAKVCLLWVAKGIEQNFRKEIKQMMSGFPIEMVIVHDTAICGRPNVAKMSVEIAQSWKAEVVIVASNPQGSRDVVGACKAAGLPVGPIWDS